MKSASEHGMRTVVVTGVSRGLGLAIATRIAGDGYKVIGMSRDKSEAYQKLMASVPEQVEFQPLDLSDIDRIGDIARETIKRSGPIYGLVSNAGIGLDGVLATMLQTDIDRVFRTNLLGPIILTKHIMRSMLSKGEGRIVNVSSIVASTGFHGLSVYAATKAGLEGFTRSLSREAGKRNITVNCVAPGYMETEMMAGLQSEKLESVRRRAPLGLPHPEHVAGAISYLLKPEACTVTGTVLTVDGGSSA
jgi:3-oxoacyl-[acyl-carrier protein] reductase